MSIESKTRVVAGLAGVVTGVLLIGTTGLTLAVGWAMWAVGLAVVLAAVPSAGEKRWGGGHEAAPSQYSLVR